MREGGREGEGGGRLRKREDLQRVGEGGGKMTLSVSLSLFVCVSLPVSSHRHVTFFSHDAITH